MIEKNDVFALVNLNSSEIDLNTKRKCFEGLSGLQVAKKSGNKSFSVNFSETIKPIFEKCTGFKLYHSSEYGNYYHVLQTDGEVEKVKLWLNSQGRRQFLRSKMDLALALDTNFTNTDGQRTEIGELEFNAKQSVYQGKPNNAVVNKIASLMFNTIMDLPFFKDTTLICAVPPSPDKTHDLPSLILDEIVRLSGSSLQNIASYFTFKNNKYSIKNLPLDEKWDAWEQTGLYFDTNSFSLRGKDVILIDDKYQSGLSIHFVAMKLKEAGARRVYGLCLVKTLRDTDNL